MKANIQQGGNVIKLDLLKDLMKQHKSIGGTNSLIKKVQTEKMTSKTIKNFLKGKSNNKIK
jgi:hypothetical protein